MKKHKIGIIGLGYVGLPLSLAFASKYETIGYDLDFERINELIDGYDRTEEVSSNTLRAVKNLSFTSDTDDLIGCNVFIVTVPTPVLHDQTPDLAALVSATDIVGKYLSRGAIVVYESTVFPGATEDVCVPILERVSGLKFNKDFFCGYSPERVNPGDKTRTIQDVVKVVSGSTPEALMAIDSLYGSVISAGTFRAASIKVAEAAKVIENVQRDVNIALINEFAMLFSKLSIDVNQVLDAASSKWNFLNFRPGLVGGHCIGVDPHYLAYKARSVGFYPKMISSGRQVNDAMGEFFALRVIKEISRRNHGLQNVSVLILGFTFKENCPDIRNTKVIDIVNSLREYSITVDCFDPRADWHSAYQEYNIKLLTKNPKWSKYDAIIYAVAHDEFKQLFLENYPEIARGRTFLYDLKNQLEDLSNIVKF